MKSVRHPIGHVSVLVAAVLSIFNGDISRQHLV